MSKLFIAAAGAGKTTSLIKSAFCKSLTASKKILITTFTDANTLEIKKRMFSVYGVIPPQIDILPWFTFLLREGARPYQRFKLQERINGVCLINGQSTKRIPETSRDYYVTRRNDIYSNKLAEFVYKLNDASANLSFKRLKNLYSAIYIDEIQDMTGYDFEIIRLLHNMGVDMIMAGDLRQAIGPNHSSQKNKKFFGHFDDYIQTNKVDIDIDYDSLNHTYRNNLQICAFANKFYPQMRPCTSTNFLQTGHDGIFIVKVSQINDYYNAYHPVILRNDKKSEKYISSLANPTIYNFGQSKGLEFDRVLIYPTNELLKWVVDSSYNLKPQTRAKSYVAVTRAKFSVAILVEDKKADKISKSSGIKLWVQDKN